MFPWVKRKERQRKEQERKKKERKEKEKNQKKREEGERKEWDRMEKKEKSNEKKKILHLRPAEAEKTFPQFKKLPVEVQHRIFKFLFPAGRRVPIDALQTGLPCFQPPITHRINRESRLLTLRHYRCVPWHWVPAPLNLNPFGGVWFKFNDNKPLIQKAFWLNPERDFVTMQYSTLIRNKHFEKVHRVVQNNMVWCSSPWVLTTARILQLLDVSRTQLSKAAIASNSSGILRHFESLEKVWLVRERESGNRRMSTVLLYKKNVQGLVAAWKALNMRGRLEKIPRIIADGKKMLEDGEVAWM